MDFKVQDDLKKFQNVYSIVYPELEKINDNDLENIDKNVKKVKAAQKTRRTWVAILGIGAALMFTGWIMREVFDSSFFEHFSNMLHDLITNNSLQRILFVSGILALFLLIGVVCRRTRDENGNRKFGYIVINFFLDNDFIVIPLYVFLLLELFIYLFALIFSSGFQVFYWALVIPIMILTSFIVLALSTFGFYMTVYLKILKPPAYWFSENHRTEILICLSNVICWCSSIVKLSSIDLRDTKSILNFLYKTRAAIERYSTPYNIYTPHIRLSEQFEGIALNLEKISEKIILQNHLNGNEIAKQLIPYYNAFLTGNIIVLPSDIKDLDIKKLPRGAKYYHYIIVVCYLLLPLALVVFVPRLNSYMTTDFNRSIIKIIYLVWAGIGVSMSPIFNNAKTKDIVTNLLKGYVGK